MKAIPVVGMRVTCVLSLLGCQLAWGSGDGILIAQLLNNFKESVLAQDIDRFGSLFSERQSDAQDEPGQNVREVMTALMDARALYDIQVPIEQARTVMNDDGTATVFPVKATGLNLDVTERFTLVKEDGAWLISNIEIVEGHWQTVLAPGGY